jgi:hypothetical protein
MNEPREYLSRDLKALRYLDALDAGDLEVAYLLWEEASHDPELERVLAELDGAVVPQIPGHPSSLPERPGRRWRRLAVWGAAVGTLAAACLLAILASPWRNIPNQGSNPPRNPTGTGVAHQPPDVSHDLTPSLGVRRDLNLAAMPRFVWPLESRLTASISLNRID